MTARGLCRRVPERSNGDRDRIDQSGLRGALGRLIELFRNIRGVAARSARKLRRRYRKMSSSNVKLVTPRSDSHMVFALSDLYGIECSVLELTTLRKKERGRAYVLRVSAEARRRFAILHSQRRLA